VEVKDAAASAADSVAATAATADAVTADAAIAVDTGRGTSPGPLPHHARA